MANFAQFHSIYVRPYAKRNADKAMQVLAFKHGRISFVDFATDALNEKSCAILKKAKLEPELPPMDEPLNYGPEKR